MTTSLPPLEVAFRVTGLDEVKAAFKSIHQAALDSEKAATEAVNRGSKQRVSSAKKEADERIKEDKRVVKELEKTAKEATKALDKENKQRERDEAASLKKREKAAKEAQKKTEEAHKAHREQLNSILGIGKGSTANSIGTAYSGGGIGGVASLGAVGAVMGGLALLGGALSLASTALSQFGGFVLNDIIKPFMNAQTSARQISNKLGGSASGDQIHSLVSGFSAEFGVEIKDAMDTFSEAVDNFGNFEKARTATEMAMQASQAYGIDKKAAAGFIQNAWQKNPTATSDEIKGLVSSMILMSLKEKSTMGFGALMQSGGKGTLSAGFFGGQSAGEKNYHTIASAGLLFLTKGALGSTETAVDHQNMAWQTASSIGGTQGWKQANGDLKGESFILNDLMKKTKGDSTKIEKLGFDKGSALYFSVILKKLSEDSRGFDAALKDAIEAQDVNINLLKEQSDKMKSDPGITIASFWETLKASFGGFADNILKMIQKTIASDGKTLEQFVNSTIIPGLLTFLEVILQLGSSVMDLIDFMTGKKNFNHGERDAVDKLVQGMEDAKFDHIMKTGTAQEKKNAVDAREAEAAFANYTKQTTDALMPGENVAKGASSVLSNAGMAFGPLGWVSGKIGSAVIDKSIDAYHWLDGSDDSPQSVQDDLNKKRSDRAASEDAATEAKAKYDANQIVSALSNGANWNITVDIKGDLPPGSTATATAKPIGQK